MRKLLSLQTGDTGGLGTSSLFPQAGGGGLSRYAGSRWGVLWVAVALGLAWMLLQAAISLAIEMRGHSYVDLYRDTIAIGRLPLHSGLLSNIGCMLMTAAASCALFAYASLDAAHRQKNRFLLWGGVVSAIFAVDDFLLLHDGYFGRIGIPEEVTQITYAVFMAAWIVYFHRRLLATGVQAVIILGLALFGLGASAGIDVVLEKIVPAVGVLEEPMKQWGFFFWLAFFAVAGRDAIFGASAASAPAATANMRA
ncbi:hypothetical protein [Aureimonas populi]|uniref:Oxidase n=1 Tax=Aureimonas populi TaxID=1701758 RepID=A0ABW5CJL7_9HYPH|nr:hypothetical protein [Aureimonas populi]